MTQRALPFAEAPIFAPGARVVIRDEEWLVRATKPASLSHAAVYVTGVSELVRGRDAIFRTELDSILVLRPEETRLVQDPTAEYRRSRLYLESLLRRTPPTDDKIHIGHTAAMKAMPYQLVPAAKALAQLRPRILIADGVGIGKTVEVGILLTELIQRGQGQRILVIALKSMLTQLQQEFWARFTIPLVRLDSVGLERVRAKIPSNQNPFGYFDKVILSVDTLKNDAKYRAHLENSRWDAIVIDECQNVITKENGRSQRSRLAERLAPTTNALILTSATPHDGTATSFASLMNLLEPTAVATPDSYTKEDVKGLFVRRFKKDIAAEAGGNFRERDAQLLRVNASSPEDAAFDALASLEFRTIDQYRKSGAGDLFKTTLLKAFLSSPAACLSTIGERAKRLAKSDKDPADIRFDQAHLAELRTVVEAVTPERIAKLIALYTYLEAIGIGPKSPERVVIFSERIQTLAFLQRELQRKFKLRGAQVVTFHGSLDDLDQQEIVRSFAAETSEVRILLASDAASEGLNLHQQCHRLVHFDVPWSLIRLSQRDGRIDRFGQTKTPEIRYLLTIPSNRQLKGDLRIIERLAQREAVAEKNLGDVAWLMNLHDADLEEARVAKAIETHEPAEAVVPDAPPEEDFLSALFGEDPEAPPDPETAASLYTDDAAYAKAAFSEILTKSKGGDGPEWHKDGRGFNLTPPEELRHRFEYLPREVAAQDELVLTTDRARVDAALTKARNDGGWPKESLLWGQHPVMAWLNDRALASFERHEAPVVHVARGLERARACFIVQGVLSNKLSQPVVVEWMGIVVGRVGPPEVLPFAQIAERTGLGQKLVNDHSDIDLTKLSIALPSVVTAAEEHMKIRRKAREKDIAPRLQSELRRLKEWAVTRDAQIDARAAAIEATRKIRSDEETTFANRRADVERRLTEKDEWIKQRLRTEPTPYIRIAAVLVSREVRS